MCVQAEWSASLISRRGDRDYMMRSEKRPGRQGAAPPPRRRRKKPTRHPVYALITILLLVTLYPAGLVLLWVRKLRWRSATKLTLSLVTGVAFFALAAFALNAPVDNPLLMDVQARAKGQLTRVTRAVHAAVSNKEAIEHNLTVEGPRAVNLASNAATRSLVAGVRQTQDNLQIVYNRADMMLESALNHMSREGWALLESANMLPPATPPPARKPAAAATPAPTATPSPTAAPTPEPEAVGAFAHMDMATPALTDVTVTPGVSVVQSPVAPSPTPVVPTPTPRPTPTPTPSPTPVVLPAVKPFGETKVYFFDRSKFYHMRPTCGSMHDAPARTLAEAKEKNKKRCNACKAPDLKLLEAEMAVWCGTDNVFHITDECAALTERWTGMTFEEAWLEEGMSGCILCGADLYAQEGKKAVAATPAPAPVG